MKRLLIACVLFLCIVPFASAVTFAELGTFQGNIAGGQNISLSMTRAELCAIYGLTPYSGQTDILVGIYPSTFTPPTDESTARLWWTYPPSRYPGEEVTLPLNTSSGYYVEMFGSCDPGTQYHSGGYWRYYGYPALIPAPIANFTGTPLSGTAPLTVSFTDTSTNVTALDTFNWSVSPAPGVSITTPAAQDTQMTFGAVGNYTITHGVSNNGGSSIATKTEYIYVYNSTSTTTLHVTAINALNAYPIHGAQVNLYDVENSTWSNTTTTDGTGTITALNSHTINAYASASGFADGDKLGIPVTNTYDSILLFPTNITSVIEGNVTLFVSVFDSADHSKPIVGAGVTVITPTTAQGGFTNSGGSAQFAVPNKTTVLIDVSATGYFGATQSTYTGTGSGGSASVTTTIYLSKKTVTPTAVITTLPGGGYPTTQPTILDGCEDPMSPECQASQNEYSMGWLSQNGLMLIQFFVVCFIVFMLKGMGR